MHVKDIPSRLRSEGFGRIENPKLKKSNCPAKIRQAKEDEEVRKAVEARVGHVMIYHIRECDDVEFISAMNRLGLDVPDKCYKRDWRVENGKRVEFRTNELLCNKATVVILKGHRPKKDSKGGIAAGIAFCSKKEHQYSPKKGSNIAMYRAVQKLAECERRRIRRAKAAVVTTRPKRKVVVPAVQ